MTDLRHLAAWINARLGTTERGASLVEYALLLALIAVVCIAAVTFLGNRTSSGYEDMGNSFANM